MGKRLERGDLLAGLRSQLLSWVSSQPVVAAAHYLAFERLSHFGSVPGSPAIILTSVTRVVDQKVFLMRAPGSDGKPGLQALLEAIGDTGLFILLGTGDRSYEGFLLEMSSRFGNFVFLNGYSDACANALYAGGDLFVMPSSFEPCGISQMLALRSGQPCLVHNVGGLRDTVQNRFNGFTFDGRTVAEQVDSFVRACGFAVELKLRNPDAWNETCRNAAESRFDWSDATNSYLKNLYAAPARL